MKVSLSVEHNGEYIPIDTHEGISISDIEQACQFIETLKDGEVRNVRLDFPDKYYTFKGEIKKGNERCEDNNKERACGTH